MSALSIAGLAFLVVSGLLLDAHRRTWREADADRGLDPRQHRASRAQYYRRMRASGLIAVVGAMFLVWPLVPQRPFATLFYVLVLVLLVGYLLVLALIDAFATSLRLRKVRHQQESARTKLEAELQAARNRQGGQESAKNG